MDINPHNLYDVSFCDAIQGFCCEFGDNDGIQPHDVTPADTRALMPIEAQPINSEKPALE